jgi:hypothetical protein
MGLHTGNPVLHAVWRNLQLLYEDEMAEGKFPAQDHDMGFPENNARDFPSSLPLIRL